MVLVLPRTKRAKLSLDHERFEQQSIYKKASFWNLSLNIRPSNKKYISITKGLVKKYRGGGPEQRGGGS